MTVRPPITSTGMVSMYMFLEINMLTPNPQGDGIQEVIGLWRFPPSCMGVVSLYRAQGVMGRHIEFCIYKEQVFTRNQICSYPNSELLNLQNCKITQPKACWYSSLTGLRYQLKPYILCHVLLVITQNRLTKPQWSCLKIHQKVDFSHLLNSDPPNLLETISIWGAV